MHAGTDGTGRAITSQLASLNASGYDVFCMTLSPKDRSNFQQLTSKTLPILRELLAAQGRDRIVLFGESFGGAWALRVAAAAPEIIEHLVLLNPGAGVHACCRTSILLRVYPSAGMYVCMR